MEKLKLKVKNTTEVEKEVSLPYCSTDGCTYWKIITPTKALQACNLTDHPHIQIGWVEHALVDGRSEITEVEFNEVYEATQKRLQNT